MKILILIFIGLIAANASAQPSAYVGFYSAPSKRCTFPADPSVCRKSNDCLLISEKRRGIFTVEHRSTQANGSSCDFSYQMRFKGDRSYLADENGSGEGQVFVVIKDDRLVIERQGASGFNLGVCGVAADIDGIEFLRSKKGSSEKGRHCSEDY